MKKPRIGEERPLASRSPVHVGETLLERVDDSVTADAILAAKVNAIMLEAQLVLKLEKARRSCGLTQKELAARIGASQPKIARLERTGYAGSLRMLLEYAAACGRKLTISIE